MKIITTPDLRLREHSEEVTEINDEIRGIIDEMRKLSIDWEKDHPYELSAAMAAPQMGVLKRIIIVRDNNNKDKATFTALINPEIIRADGSIVRAMEGCLSVPNFYGKVPRASKVTVRAELETGEPVRLKARGELARTLLHEIDHLDGVLFIDHIRNNRKAFYTMDDKGNFVPVTDYEKLVRNNPELWGED